MRAGLFLFAHEPPTPPRFFFAVGCAVPDPGSENQRPVDMMWRAREDALDCCSAFGSIRFLVAQHSFPCGAAFIQARRGSSEPTWGRCDCLFSGGHLTPLLHRVIRSTKLMRTVTSQHEFFLKSFVPRINTAVCGICFRGRVCVPGDRGVAVDYVRTRVECGRSRVLPLSGARALTVDGLGRRVQPVAGACLHE